ncbi:hypothetical protein HK104_010353 [Borealophlyctis nickersoniae]|nr:hypothetical protein HK104_010353 [Borealophlyctis nickersoniae]
MLQRARRGVKMAAGTGCVWLHAPRRSCHVGARQAPTPFPSVLRRNQGNGVASGSLAKAFVRAASTTSNEHSDRAGDKHANGENMSRRTVAKKKGVRYVGAESDVGAPRQELSKATAFCTAESYDFASLLPLLRKQYVLLPYIAEDVYQVELTDPATLNAAPWSESDSSHHGPKTGEAFIFRNGTFVTWGATAGQMEKLLRLVKKVEMNSYGRLETEEFHYYEDPDQANRLVADVIVLGNSLPSNQAKLAYSAGLSRSVKLGSLEELLDAHLEKNRHIPQFLLQGRKLPLGRDAMLRNLGELFSLRGHLNLHSELLDLPEFCWSSHQMETCFDRISNNLDVRPRIGIFNKKLDYANELAEVLRNHLHEQHSLKLEWCIIILISVEICFEFIHWMDKIGMIDVEGAYRALMRKEPRVVKGEKSGKESGFIQDEPVLADKGSNDEGNGEAPSVAVERLKPWGRALSSA